METELLATFTHLRDTALTIIILLPAVAVGLFALKGLWPDHWRL